VTSADKRCVREAVQSAFGHLEGKDADPAIRAVLTAPWPASMSKKYAKHVGVDAMVFHAIACREWAKCCKDWKREEGW
jgi:hypothetical protein